MKKLSITNLTGLTLAAALLLPGLAMAYTPYRTMDPTGEPIIQRVALEEPSTTTVRQFDLQKGRERLTGMLNQLQTHFQKTREKATSLQKLTEASGVDIVKTIDNYLAQINTLKLKVTNVQTPDELKKVANEVHGLIQEAKHEVKKNIGHRVEVHIDKFSQKSEEGERVVDRAKQRLEDLKRQGVAQTNLQNVDKSLEDCRKLLEKGNQNLKGAKAKFEQVQDLPASQHAESAQLMREGMKMVNDARATYGQARRDCSHVMRELRELK